MAILENTTDYSAGDQVTPANLNALTESAKFVRAGAGITSTGNTTDETTLDVDTTNGELKVKDAGIGTTQLTDSGVTTAKINDSGVTTAKINDGAVTTAKLGADSVTEAKIADDAVESEHLNDNVISGQTELSAAPADADEMLISDAGTIKKIGIDNLMKHPALPKAYGIVTADTGTPTMNEAYNCSLNSDTTTTRVIDLSNAMNDTNYVVTASYGEASGTDVDSGAITVNIGSASQFTLTIGGESADRTVHFAVFGTLA